MNTTQPHTLSLESKFARELDRVMLYAASCSCGSWSLTQKPAIEARALHAQHLQQLLGPEARAKRCDFSDEQIAKLICGVEAFED